MACQLQCIATGQPPSVALFPIGNAFAPNRKLTKGRALAFAGVENTDAVHSWGRERLTQLITTGLTGCAGRCDVHDLPVRVGGLLCLCPEEGAHIRPCNPTPFIKSHSVGSRIKHI